MNNQYYFPLPNQYGGSQYNVLNQYYKQHSMQNNRSKANKILEEMVDKHKKKKKRNNIENKVSQYLLLFSVDIDFRGYLCNLINELYATKVTPDRINEQTIRFLVIHHLPVMEEVFSSFLIKNNMV